LTQSVQRLDEVKHLVLMPPENETWGLLDVDLLLENAIQERGLDIHVVHCPAFIGSVGE
jgi:hypothetical protein